MAYSQYVRRFQITMDHSLFDEILIASEHLFHDFDGIRLIKFFFLFDVLVQVAVGAILKYEVIEIGCFDDFIQSEYVLVD